MRLISKLAAAALIIYAGAVGSAVAQSSTGKATTAAPTYLNNSNAPLSLDLSGNLRVVNAGSPTGTQDVNLTEVGGTPVTSPLPVSVQNTVPVSGTINQGTAGVSPWVVNITDLAGTPIGATVPGAMDVTCVSGCVAGSGVSQGTATTAPPTYTTGTNNPLSLDLAGNLRTSMLTPLVAGSAVIGGVNQAGTWNVGLNAGSNVIGHVITDSGSTTAVTQATAANLNATVVGTGTFAVQAAQSGTWNVNVMPPASSGTSNYSLIAANSTNATSVVAGAHSLYEISVYNNSSVIAYLKLYDSGSAPTCGSGTPVARYLIPGASAGGAGSNVNINMGKAFASGIAFCLTTGIADADTGAVAANAYLVNMTYK